MFYLGTCSVCSEKNIHSAVVECSVLEMSIRSKYLSFTQFLSNVTDVLSTLSINYRDRC